MAVRHSFGQQKHDLTGKKTLQFFAKAQALQTSQNQYFILQNTGIFLIVGIASVLAWRMAYCQILLFTSDP
jgi:hypothetical protein